MQGLDVKIAELQQTLIARDARILELEGMLADLENQQTELTNDLNRYTCSTAHWGFLFFIRLSRLNLHA